MIACNLFENVYKWTYCLWRCDCEWKIKKIEVAFYLQMSGAIALKKQVIIIILYILKWKSRKEIVD
jgi:hypothetical protein